MDQRFYKIIVALLISFKVLMSAAWTQQPQPTSIAVPGPLSMKLSKTWYAPAARYFNISQHLPDTSYPVTLPLLRVALPVQNFTSSPSSITRDYYTKHFGFFCRQELQFEKASGLPLRFRMGSLQDCDYLEGK
ncbi:hypothetical protein [Paraflavitalea pollutisoli]|uniref:hypothetical protein n=1 Tax=Paraflavitalea pollutisoli TaxID=3034143 RepID=UPI0023EBA5DF|nr:hypothetical protein [Paraflavitalea sp. H1-2-19X]